LEEKDTITWIEKKIWNYARGWIPYPLFAKGLRVASCRKFLGVWSFHYRITPKWKYIPFKGDVVELLDRLSSTCMAVKGGGLNLGITPASSSPLKSLKGRELKELLDIGDIGGIEDEEEVKIGLIIWSLTISLILKTKKKKLVIDVWVCTKKDERGKYRRLLQKLFEHPIAVYFNH
jgi:hypothetical protein